MVAELEARALKATVVLDPAALLAMPPPANGVAKVTLRIRLPDRVLTADLNAKSLRRAITATAAAGAENVAVVLQGKLEAGDVLTEAGIAAQPKAPKVAAAA